MVWQVLHPKGGLPELVLHQIYELRQIVPTGFFMDLEKLILMCMEKSRQIMRRLSYPLLKGTPLALT